MTDQPDPQGLSPFARSIHALFEEPEPSVEDAPPDESTSAASEEGVRGAAPESPAATGEEATELRTAVAAYLASSDDASRMSAAAELRSRYAAARALRLNDAMADALAALARLAGSRQGAGELARDLIGPVEASTLASRLVAAAPEARRERAAFLAVLGDEIVRAIAHLLNDTEDRKARHALIPLLAQLLPSAPHVAEELVADPRWYAVRNAVHAIGEAGDEAGMQHLTGTVAHAHPKVRRESVLALQKIGGDTAGVLVLARLEDADSTVRAAAARATGALGLERGLRVLVQRLEEEEDEDVIVAACRALGSLGDPSAVPILEKRAVGGFFSKPPTEVRIAAYQGLAAIGTPHARKLLAAASEDKDPEVRAAVQGMGGPRS